PSHRLFCCHREHVAAGRADSADSPRNYRSGTASKPRCPWEEIKAPCIGTPTPSYDPKPEFESTIGALQRSRLPALRPLVLQPVVLQPVVLQTPPARDPKDAHAETPPTHKHPSAT